MRDAPHVTEFADEHVLVRTEDGEQLTLWDTPGFGDSARLAAPAAPVAAADRLVSEPGLGPAGRPAASGPASRRCARCATTPTWCSTSSMRPRARPPPATWCRRWRCCAGSDKPVLVLLNQLGRAAAAGRRGGRGRALAAPPGRRSAWCARCCRWTLSPAAGCRSAPCCRPCATRWRPTQGRAWIVCSRPGRRVARSSSTPRWACWPPAWRAAPRRGSRWPTSRACATPCAAWCAPPASRAAKTRPRWPSRRWPRSSTRRCAAAPAN